MGRGQEKPVTPTTTDEKRAHRGASFHLCNTAAVSTTAMDRLRYQRHHITSTTACPIQGTVYRHLPLPPAVLETNINVSSIWCILNNHTPWRVVIRARLVWVSMIDYTSHIFHLTVHTSMGPQKRNTGHTSLTNHHIMPLSLDRRRTNDDVGGPRRSIASTYVAGKAAKRGTAH